MTPKKKNQKKAVNVPISADENKESFQLHIETAKTAKESAPTKKVKKETESAPPKKKSGLGRKLWNFLEWVSVSAVIFIIFFFVMNFSSYSELLQLKLGRLFGTYQPNPYIEGQLDGNGGNADESLLPYRDSSELARQEIPPLNLDIAPPDDRVIIPRINKNVPIVGVSTENLVKRDWTALENDIQDALRYGVVHYPGTAEPGETGNVVVTGHSSYFPWDPGRFKDVFALLHEIVVGDQVVVYNDQQKHIYEVYETKVVNPDQVEVLTQQGDDRLTLITCTPVGTNLRRLIVLARPI
ncbi:sortase [Candidatus Peregrinibacteria bacterium]|nr:sortase [Candidatus Peregrinibacteria bacterium]